MSGRLFASSLLVLAALQAPALAQGSSSQSTSQNNQAKKPVIAALAARDKAEAAEAGLQ